MIDDLRLARLQRTLAGREAVGMPREPGTVEAAVALLLRPRSALELLLIKRAEHAHDPWSGHMALPGGRRAAADADLAATACRETHEEAGIPVQRVGTLLGALDEVHPRSRRLPPIIIAPFVAGVPADTTATPDPREVASALWIPLEALREEGAAGEILVELGNGQRSAFPSLVYREHVIWGLTHRILMQFLDVARQAGV